MTDNTPKIAPFNQILGTASSNVPAYSNTSDEVFSIERNFVHGVFTGIKWQCVEYARRWLLIRKGCVFKNVGHAADIWSELSSVERVTDGMHFPLKRHPNGSPTLPTIDSFLIYCRTEEQPVGHIAIICEVGPDYVRIAEQNNKFHFWEDNHARQIPVVQKDGLYYIEDEDPLYGWMEIDDNNQLEPFSDTTVSAIHHKYKKAQLIGNMERCLIVYKSDDAATPWLSKDDPAENFFMKLYGEQLQRANSCPENLPYYKVNQDLLFSVGSASNELHRMFLEATERVIQNDELFTRFGIPQVFWNRIRQSWAEEQNSSIAGRLDLAFDGKQLKVFEYNADSASALFECAIIQRKWAQVVKLPSMFLSAFRLHHSLVGSWKRMNITTLVHIMIDDDDDERLTALYMQNVFKEAGIESKLCVKIDQFHWKDAAIIDSDGVPVKMVWKLWMWETVFEDYADAVKVRGVDGWKPVDGEHPRISDILLHDQIKVIEPLWKAITSNKALLPVLWTMYPNHSLLLHSEWTLTDELKHGGFVKKPIVGRCGQNVTLYNSGDQSVTNQTTGKFSARNSIYQQMFHLKNFDGYHPVIGSWIIRGHFGGFCIREDQKLITDADSPVAACCIVWDEEK